jgi:hypothetical protein
MRRIHAYIRRYGIHAATVLSSIAKVAAAGRSRDQDKIDAERDRHRRLMSSLP